MKTILIILLFAIVACEAETKIEEVEPELKFDPIPFIKCLLADGKLFDNVAKVIDAIKNKDLVTLITIVPAIVNEVTVCWNDDVNLQSFFKKIGKKIKKTVKNVTNKVKKIPGKVVHEVEKIPKKVVSEVKKVPKKLEAKVKSTLQKLGKVAAKKACEALVGSEFPEFAFFCEAI